MNDVLIYGAGGFSREVDVLLTAINIRTPTWNLLGYVDDDVQKHGKTIHDQKILGSPEDILQTRIQQPTSMIIAIGQQEILVEKPVLLRKVKPDLQFPTLIHPSAILDKYVTRLGEGNIITAGCLFTTDAQIGDFNMINLGTIIAHDVKIGNYCIINPGVIINGWVRVEDRCMIGAGAVIMDRVTIGEGSSIALGAVVGTDVEPFTVVAGNPARVVRRLSH